MQKCIHSNEQIACSLIYNETSTFVQNNIHLARVMSYLLRRSRHVDPWSSWFHTCCSFRNRWKLKTTNRSQLHQRTYTSTLCGHLRQHEQVHYGLGQTSTAAFETEVCGAATFQAAKSSLPVTNKLCLLLSTSIADTNMFKTNMTNNVDTDNISTSSSCLWPLLSGGTAVGLGPCGVVTHSRAQWATCIACEQRTRRPIDWWRKNSSM